MRRLIPAQQGDERGVVVILVAAAVVTMLAMAALVIDVGAMVHERRELQNGADAAALSIAQSCALREAACSSPTGEATTLAGSNAGDGVSAVESVAVDLTARTVRVKTRTATNDGSNLVPFHFGRAITGQSGESLRATSVATWGALGQATTIPLALSKCEFDAAAFDTTTVIFHTSSAAAAHCNEGPAGQDIPGGFGWLDLASGGACELGITAGGSAGADTGLPPPLGCGIRSILGTTVLIPIFDSVTGAGTTARYHIAGFGAFELTGFRFPVAGVAGSPVPCRAPDTCIGGRFTQFVTGPGPIGGSDFGVSTVKLVA